MIVDNIFRAVRTIKGTWSFLGVPRLEASTHVSETMGNPRDDIPVTGEAVTLILAAFDHKLLLNDIDRHQAEWADDSDLIAQFDRMSTDASPRTAAFKGRALGSIVSQVLERSSPSGDAVLDELKPAVREIPSLSVSHAQAASAVGTTTSLAARSAAADGAP